MSKRLQIVLDDEELNEIRVVARREHVTVSAWVRAVLRRARVDPAHITASQKMHAIHSAVKHSFPTADIEPMLAEIDSGYRGGLA